VLTLCVLFVLETWRGGICEQISQATCDKGWSCDTFCCQEVMNYVLYCYILKWPDFCEQTVLFLPGLFILFSQPTHCLDGKVHHM
jgi:hypothetical protein